MQCIQLQNIRVATKSKDIYQIARSAYVFCFCFWIEITFSEILLSLDNHPILLFRPIQLPCDWWQMKTNAVVNGY